MAQVVADADGLLELARQAPEGLTADSGKRQAIVEAAELLGQLLLQDVQPSVLTTTLVMLPILTAT